MSVSQPPSSRGRSSTMTGGLTGGSTGGSTTGGCSAVVVVGVSLTAVIVGSDLRRAAAAAAVDEHGGDRVGRERDEEQHEPGREQCRQLGRGGLAEAPGDERRRRLGAD